MTSYKCWVSTNCLIFLPINVFYPPSTPPPKKKEKHTHTQQRQRTSPDILFNLQVAFLKDIVAKKDGEIQNLQLSKANANGTGHGITSLRYGSSSPRRHSVGPSQQSRRLSGGKGSGLMEKAASDMDNCSEYSDKHSEAGSHQSMDEFRHQKELSPQLKLSGGDVGQGLKEDIELLGFGDGDSEERLSDISDGGLSMGTETEGSICSVVEYTLFPEVAKPAENRPPECAPAEDTPVQNKEK